MISYFLRKTKTLTSAKEIRWTYKCFVPTSISRPGVVPLETGIVPESLLSAKSSQESFDRLPIDAGIGPLKPLEFKDLRITWYAMSIPQRK